MPRYKLTLEYDGTPFIGWQRQKTGLSVQEALETALAKLQPDGVEVSGAGRTDSGVHALGQVAHIDLAAAWDPFRLGEALNHHLRPLPIAVLRVEIVSDDFHARFSAVERRYLYRIIQRRAPLALDRGKIWRVSRKLDVTAMQAGAAFLIGNHDFTTFRAAQCQAKSPVKTIDLLRVEEVGDEIRIEAHARSFLHNQIRSIAGTLERVGVGAWAPEQVKQALEARDRAMCGPVAPPEGLYLTAVIYPNAAP